MNRPPPQPPDGKLPEGAVISDVTVDEGGADGTGDNCTNYLHAKLSKKKDVAAFIDGGNNFRSVVSEDVANDLGFQQHKLVPLPDNIIVRSADHNHQLALMGEFPHAIDMYIAGERYWIKPVVVRGLRSGINISHPFLKKAGWKIDFSSGEVLTKRKQRYSMMSHKQYQKKVKGSRSKGGPSVSAIKVELGPSDEPMEEEEGVYLAEAARVPPLSAMIVKVRRGHPHKGAATGVILGSAKFMEANEGCHTAAASYTEWDEQGFANTALLNTSGTCIDVKPNAKIGFFEEGAEIETDETRAQLQEMAIASFQLAEACGPGNCTEMPEDLYMGGPKSNSNKDKRDYIDKIFKLKENQTLSKNKEHYKAALDLLVAYYDVFAFDGNYGHTDLVQHRIDVKPGTRPFKDKQVTYRC